MNLEMTIKKLGSAYKFRVGRATGNEHIFVCPKRDFTLVQKSYCFYPDVRVQAFTNAGANVKVFEFQSVFIPFCIYHTTKTVYGSELASLTDTVASLKHETKSKA